MSLAFADLQIPCRRRSARRCAVAALGLLLASACTPRDDSHQDLVPAELHALDGAGHIEWPLPPAETEAEGPVYLRVGGLDVDFRVELRGADGSLKSAADAPNDRLGVVTLELPSPRPAGLRARIVGEDHPSRRGEVELRLIGASGPDPALALAALAAEARACRAFATLAGRTEAAQAFTDAARSYDQARDTDAAGLAWLQSAGAGFAHGQDFPRVALDADRAAELLPRGPRADRAARALRVAAAARYSQALALPAKEQSRQLALAIDAFSTAADAARSAGATYEAAYATIYRGSARYETDDFAGTWADYAAAWKLFEAAGDAPGQAMALDAMAVWRNDRGEHEAALALLERALALGSATADPVGYQSTLHNAALPLVALGRFDAAIARYTEANRLARELGLADAEARALLGIAGALRASGDPERAAATYREALALAGAGGEARVRGRALSGLAEVLLASGRLAEARALLQEALPLANNPNEIARVRALLSRVEREAGALESAREHAEAVLALGLAPTHRRRADALVELAELEWQKGDPASARTLLSEALAIHVRADSPLGQSAVRAQRARLDARQKRWGAAVTEAEAAIALVETVGLAAPRGEQRAQLLATARDAVETRITAELALADAALHAERVAEADGHRLAALSVADRLRALGLLAALSAGPGLSPQPVGQDGARLEQLAAKRARRDALRESQGPDDPRVRALERDIALLRAKPRGDDMPQPAAATDALVRRALGELPRGVVLGEYFLGPRESWLFEVRDGRLAVHRLGPTGAIEREARRLRETWSQRSGAVRDDAYAMRAASALLLGWLPPAATSVWIVPDGVLHEAPIPALVTMAAPGETGPARAVRVLPSLATWMTANEGGVHAGKDRLRGAARIGVVADPVYESGDPRWAQLASATQGTPEAVSAGPVGVAATRSAARVQDLRRLPAAGREAAAIAALWPAGQLTVLSGHSATGARVAGLLEGEFAVLHFATHAFADAEDPEFSALVLSRRTPRSLPDTFTAYEIERTGVRAGLVVLSGCDTGRGRRIGGEGVLGLVHALHKRGVAEVVASQWQVPDAATATLMEAFYRELLREDGSGDAALALAKAQAQLRAGGKWSRPYYWAGFQVWSLATN